jgi:3-methyladenine DNA glycosylase AlkD
MNAAIRAQLKTLSEPKLRDFTAKLTPNISIDSILGIRVGTLRTLAKQMARQADWETQLAENEDVYMEETMLRGFIINYAKMPFEKRLELTAAFVPRIDNWAVCDTFCYDVKAQEKPLFWEFIQPYLKSDKAYNIRFGTIEILRNFIDNEYVSDVFEIFENIKNEDYYVRMGVAWTLSFFFIKMPDRTFDFLKNNRLDDFTHNKTLQKIIESRRVNEETKEMIRTLKRRKSDK